MTLPQITYASRSVWTAPLSTWFLVHILQGHKRIWYISYSRSVWPQVSQDDSCLRSSLDTHLSTVSIGHPRILLALEASVPLSSATCTSGQTCWCQITCVHSSYHVLPLSAYPPYTVSLRPPVTATITVQILLVHRVTFKNDGSPSRVCVHTSSSFLLKNVVCVCVEIL